MKQQISRSIILALAMILIAAALTRFDRLGRCRRWPRMEILAFHQPSLVSLPQFTFHRR